jgi:hypothetical protein
MTENFLLKKEKIKLYKMIYNKPKKNLSKGFGILGLIWELEQRLVQLF